jgi:hypothetical protein
MINITKIKSILMPKQRKPSPTKSPPKRREKKTLEEKLKLKPTESLPRRKPLLED